MMLRIMMEKPDCLEGEMHIWVFPTGTGTTKIFGTKSMGGHYSGSEVSISYKRTAICRVCDQKYTFENIKSPYSVKEGRKKAMGNQSPRKQRRRGHGRRRNSNRR